jgi:rSAM/selenodomain-associated transferase 2
VIGPLVSVIVPVLEEASELPALLDHLAALPGRFEFVVIDGGSRDATAELARTHRLRPRVAESAAGRAMQMNLGAELARGELFVFLHADTRLPAGAYAALAGALSRPGLSGGNFSLRFDGDDRFARLLRAWYAIQRRLGVYYGDSAIWARGSTWEALGGFRPLPIMEDYEFVRRLERSGQTACLAGPAVTSGRRWRRFGVARTVLTWAAIRWLWLAGVPAERLSTLYRHAR